MPPKSKFTRDEIVKVALEIVRENGIKALTARALGARLGSSACPIFTVFENMEDVQSAVKIAARALYCEYIKQGFAIKPAFKGIGIQYIRFAMEEPRLFELLFMSILNEAPNIDNVLPIIDESYGEILMSVETSFGLDEKDSEEVYHHLWIYSHGIAVLSATKTCTFTLNEVDAMLTSVCKAIIKDIKGGKIQ